MGEDRSEARIRWFVVDSEGETYGPLDGSEVAAMIRDSDLVIGNQVREENSAQWLPIERSPFASAIQEKATAANAKRAAKNRRQWRNLTLLCAVALVVTAVVVLRSKVDEKLSALSVAPPIAAGTPQEPSLNDLVRSEPKLDNALSLLVPRFNDAIETDDPAGLLFLAWSSARLRWADLQRVESTKPALVKKDPQRERGKRLCATGSVVEIHTKRYSDTVVYDGLLNSGDIYRFHAVGSTGDIVERSQARICGVVIGLYDYRNSGGGVSHGVAIVGMFDLPENK